jgi:LytS/YehU family sensor histidine kinase
MKFKNKNTLLIIFSIFLIAGLYISILVAFNQSILNKYIVLIFGISIVYFGAKGIYKTIKINKTE